MYTAFRFVVVFGVAAAIARSADDEFVPIKGGTLRAGIRLDDFEMATHPVTNAEYKRFVDATRHPAPPYWQNGRIPAGFERHPVVFVSRYNDVRAYTNWRSQAEGRVYRLPPSSEFEYAARDVARAKSRRGLWAVFRVAAEGEIAVLEVRTSQFRVPSRRDNCTANYFHSISCGA